MGTLDTFSLDTFSLEAANATVQENKQTKKNAAAALCSVSPEQRGSCSMEQYGATILSIILVCVRRENISFTAIRENRERGSAD